MGPYRIKGWSDTFLSDKTRGRKGRLRFLQVPVKLDDLDYIRLTVTDPDAAATFGVWLALLEVAGSLEARDGVLARGNGDPMTVGELSQLTRLPELAIERALSSLCNIGWLSSEHCGTVPNDSETFPKGLPERRGEERSRETPLSPPKGGRASRRKLTGLEGWDES